MRILLSFTLCLLLLAGLAAAAAIDGKFVSERQMQRDGNVVTITQTFDLKTEGEKLTGTLTFAFGNMEPRTFPIKDGKLAGSHFSFKVEMQTPNGGAMVTAYQGNLEGDTLKGTATREGGMERPFEAKKK